MPVPWKTPSGSTWPPGMKRPGPGPIPVTANPPKIAEYHHFTCPSCFKSNKHIIAGQGYLKGVVEIKVLSKDNMTVNHIYYCRDCFDKEAPQEVLSRLG